MIREVSEEYLLNHVHIQAVLAPEYDHDKVGRYFEGRSLNGCYGGVRQFSYLEFSDYSESKKTDKQLAQFNIRERIKELYEKGLSPEERYQYILRDPLISAWLRYVYAILTKVGDAPSHKARYFNSCYIGRTNLLLDTYGNLHLCERSDFSMPVGEVNSGINRTAVRQMYRDFLRRQTARPAVPAGPAASVPSAPPRLSRTVRFRNLTVPFAGACGTHRRNR